MDKPIVDPPVPYKGEVPDGLTPGKMVRIQGIAHPTADRFDVNLLAGPNIEPRDDTALHMSIRIGEGYIARNSYVDGGWDEEQGDGPLPIGQGQRFEIIILADASNKYKIAVNGQHYCEFPQRIPFSKVRYLHISGDLTLTLVSWEGAVPHNATQATQLNAPGPQGAPQYGGNYEMKPQGPGYGVPPGGYAPPQQGGYSGPAPPPGYVPPGAPPAAGFQIPYDAPPSFPLPPQPNSNPTTNIGIFPPPNPNPSPPSFIGPFPLPISTTPAPTGQATYPSSINYGNYPHGIHSHQHYGPGQYPPPPATSHNFPHPGYPTTTPMGVYPHKKMKKSKLKKAMKYGLPIAGVGLGAYALSKAVRHGHSSSSSTSSSSSSDSD